MAKQWTREDWVRIFEYLVERGSTITSSPHFRDALSRDENLIANQVTREANGNIAYRSVDFNLDGLTDEEIWAKLDESNYTEVIEENAAIAFVKMAEKFHLLN